jgi:hypothetical protein
MRCTSWDCSIEAVRRAENVPSGRNMGTSGDGLMDAEERVAEPDKLHWFSRIQERRLGRTYFRRSLMIMHSNNRE